MKRLFDLVVSLIGLLVLSPLFLIIAFAIVIDNKGPVLFRQLRAGRNGRDFLVYKFRTMMKAPDHIEGNFNPGDRSRITSVGQLLRKSKLDELPQLINVLKGDMSMVGPRPEIPRWVSVYPERWEKVLSVRPGITDNSSILFRDEESILSQSEDPEKTYREIILPKKLDLYEQYVESHSFSGDLKMIFRTLFSIIFK
jgi:lipopolysaccharide/colanic/teichoic acid biosynthesis glycosyltransferase